MVPSGNFAELNRTVTCMVLKANDRRTSCPCHDEFRGPRSDYVRQVALEQQLEDFGDGSRYSEETSDEDDTSAEIPSPSFITTPTGECLSLDIFNVHRWPLHDASSAVLGWNSRLEAVVLTTRLRQPCISRGAFRYQILDALIYIVQALVGC
ncbi:hypothetical protein TNCV_402251 [Trichonephila clavipes]|nr:hypothetical protein TNCV_402251 [Trichonephila clavipes]